MTSTQSSTRHAAATAVNDTKAIIEASTGVGRQSGTTDSVGRMPVEAYPCYAPMGGVTFRIDRPVGQPDLWLDATLAEAKTLLKELTQVVNEMERDEEQTAKVKDDWRKPKGVEKPRVVPTEWYVGTHNPETHPADRADEVPVYNNRKDSPVIWFKTRETAVEIVGRLNVR